MKVITNNVPRQLIYGYELTDKQKQDFDYIDDIDSHNFVKYKDMVFDVSEFMITDIDGWDGISGQSYFNGYLIKMIDSDTVIMGRYYS
ncbi:hypothetical protein [Vibrio phage vB_VhaM_VH-8]|nr:hypothetical protein [Vibrio phage vB_VhaM_VH-8]